MVKRKDRHAAPPFPAGKVREGDRLVAARNRHLRQRRDRAPGDRVVNIDGHRLAAFEGFDEGVDDEEIHAAMAGVFSLWSIFLPQGMAQWTCNGLVPVT